MGQVLGQRQARERTVALVTGGGRRLGAAIARRLAADGARVIVNFVRDRKQADANVRTIEQSGGHTRAVQADVGKPEDITRLFADIQAHDGRLDILVNNAGVNRDGPSLDMSLDDWDAVHAVHLRGAFLCRQAAARMMRAGAGGSIINIGASTGVLGRKNGVNFCTAKAGLMVMTRCLALELAPRIRVNSVVPGLVPTDETAERYGVGDAQVAENYGRKVPLGRLGTPDESAAAVSFLASPAAGFITGQTLPVNGGAYMNT